MAFSGTNNVTYSSRQRWELVETPNEREEHDILAVQNMMEQKHHASQVPSWFILFWF